MISYAVYKVMHLVGAFMIILALGGAAANSINGVPKKNSWRKSMMITHGIGMILSLVGGFGLLARLGVVHGMLPGWALAKLGIWLVFGALVGVVAKKPNSAKFVWFLIILLGAAAAYLAGSKPLF